MTNDLNTLASFLNYVEYISYSNINKKSLNHYSIDSFNYELQVDLLFSLYDWFQNDQTLNFEKLKSSILEELDFEFECLYSDMNLDLDIYNKVQNKLIQKKLIIEDFFKTIPEFSNNIEFDRFCDEKFDEIFLENSKYIYSEIKNFSNKNGEEYLEVIIDEHYINGNGFSILNNLREDEISYLVISPKALKL